jgi:PhnB protein
MVINPYLNFPGNTEEAFNFYKSVFGGEFPFIQRFKDTPEADKLRPEDADKIMHVSLMVGNAGNILMATDALESMGQKVTPGNNFYLCLSVDSKEDGDKFFNGLSQGGSVTMPMADMFWGAYFGMFVDKFGIQWMISFDKNQHA